MVVAVIAMMTVKASLVKLILVVAVRDHGMVAVLGGLSIMQVPRVLRASMVRRAPIRVPLADLDAMGHHDVALLMFEAVLVQVIDVIAVANGRMPASRSVSMCHDPPPFIPLRSQPRTPHALFQAEAARCRRYPATADSASVPML